MTHMTGAELIALGEMLDALAADDRLDRTSASKAEILRIKNVATRIAGIGDKGACGRDDCRCVAYRPGMGSTYAGTLRDDPSLPRCQGEVHQDRWGAQCSRAGLRPAVVNRTGGGLMHYCAQHAKKYAQVEVSE